MKWIDFHADTLHRLFYQEDGALGGLWENSCEVDIKRLRQSGYAAQLFACFLDLVQPPRLGSHYEDVHGMLDLFYEQIRGHEGDIRFAGGLREYRENAACGVLSGFLTLEEGGVLENSIERLEELHKRGIRVMNLTWNHENCLAYPHNSPAFREKGLKPFGLRALERMGELGVVADVSHLSDGGFWDVLRHSRLPVMASHSNARALQSVSRNLTNEMIRALAQRGGIIGLNFYAGFLSADPVSRVADLLRHCRHITNVGGEGVLGLGTDFDGMGIELELSGAQAVPRLERALRGAGFTQRQIECIGYRNAEHFFARCWG